MELINWIPVSLIQETGNPLCRWLNFGDKQFTEPFFDETISRCRQTNAGKNSFKSVSDLDFLQEKSSDLSTTMPSALIFHVSRSGSTMLSQLLALNQHNTVLAEVPFLDQVLRLPISNESFSKNSDDLFLAALKFYTNNRKINPGRVFIKTDSWHLLFYDQLRRIFPRVPFIIIYRDPLEVIRSHQRQRGIQSVPGMLNPEIFGFAQKDIYHHDLDDYMSKVLGRYFRKINQIKEETNVFHFDYSLGFEKIIGQVHQICRMPMDEDLRQKIRERCMYHSKKPNERFREENHALTNPPAIEEAVDIHRQLTAFNPVLV